MGANGTWMALVAGWQPHACCSGWCQRALAACLLGVADDYPLPPAGKRPAPTCGRSRSATVTPFCRAPS